MGKEDKKAKKEEIKKTPVKKNEKLIDDTKTSNEKINTESATDVGQMAEALDSNEAFAAFKANSGKELYSSLCSIKKSIATTKSKIQKISSDINSLVDEISSKSAVESKPA